LTVFQLDPNLFGAFLNHIQSRHLNAAHLLAYCFFNCQPLTRISHQDLDFWGKLAKQVGRSAAEA